MKRFLKLYEPIIFGFIIFLIMTVLSKFNPIYVFICGFFFGFLLGKFEDYEWKKS
jgi:hypothetical protein